MNVRPRQEQHGGDELELTMGIDLTPVSLEMNESIEIQTVNLPGEPVLKYNMKVALLNDAMDDPNVDANKRLFSQAGEDFDAFKKRFKLFQSPGLLLIAHYHSGCRSRFSRRRGGDGKKV